ncbi:serine/threonine protein kinase [Janthinobacterium sp. 17J80-10]|uniref:serine/threonine protein kinase n=1 Tax=Janthinobacterium sp. 17J80-10 TaxID=2497863 RepID=UPI0010053DAD|nr:serine/threonine protein kinase [Janthinobacterium sp. 17J80-10]QAU34942.1 protein kinase [Janthinobacterium sp. 17J80-10]
MANLADAIHSYYGSGLSRADYFAQVERALSAESGGILRMLDTLDKENARAALPPDVYAELRQRIERRAEPAHTMARENTRLQTRPEEQRWTQSSLPSGGESMAGGDPGLERMKGVGDTLNGRFVLEECIGFGGMGTVYKALDLRKLEASDRKPYIAIKVLNVQFRGHPKSLIALQREARKAQTLAHPNIVTVYDFDRDGSMVYLTMEYLSGKPLSQILRAPGFTGLPFAEVLHIVTGISRALAYAHERGFVHCDLKPANVFLLDKGEVKVIDFGISRVFHKTEEDSEATVFDAGSLGGLTPAYASPEMIEHLDPDPRDDIYALACITYELLTGKHPFDRTSATQARNAGMRPQRPASVGSRQWRAIKAALAFERNSRTPSVTEFLRELSGEPGKTLYVAAAASGLTLVVLLAAGLSYYVASRPDASSGGGVSQEASSGARLPAEASPPEVASPPVSLPPSPPRQASTTEAPTTQAPTTEAPTTQAATTQAPTTQPPAPALTLAVVTPVLAQVPCSALTATLRDGSLQVQGFLARSVGASRLKQMLAALPGARGIDIQTLSVGDADCPVIATYAPYWKRNRQAGRPAAIQSRVRSAELKEGEPLIVDIKTPAYDSYVHVDYFVLDGNVAHLVPNPRMRANQAPANYEAAIGSLGNWVISAPFGTELIVLLLTPAPLFDKVRPEVESQAEYLKVTEKQLAQFVAKHGADRIVADFVQITTKPAKP